jgi:hypothetical protein
MGANAVIDDPKVAARRLAEPAIRDGFVPEALHVYTAIDGSPVHWRIRAKHPVTGEKWIRPMRRSDDGFALGEPDYPAGKPLYALHLLANRLSETVVVVEGEWCADALARVGVLATTSGSADSAEKADWRPLAGRSVLVWGDNDAPGARYADQVVERLLELGCDVRVVDREALGLPVKGDAVDWLTLHPGASPEDVLGLPWKPTPPMSCTSSDAARDNAATSASSVPETDDQAIVRLGTLNPLEYERVRETEAARLGVRVTVLDRQVAAARRVEVDAGLSLQDIDPWPEPVDPAALLSEIDTTVRRFIVCREETADAVVLWIAMTWFMDAVQVAPLAVITAPEKRCGKSQLLTLLGRLVRRPLLASNISPAALFRSIDAWQPTLLVDEVDAFLRDNEELRGLLNCGHTRDTAYVVRVVGEDFVPTRFNVWGAKALAGIGHLADTLMDRAIVLELRRKLPHETVDRLRHAEPRLFEELAAKLARFALDTSEAVRRARPDLPVSLNDRAQDNWEPLLAIAEVAGGPWPALARAAALTLSRTESPTMTVGTELLVDIRSVFDVRQLDRITTAKLIDALCADEEAPWATYNRGKPITPRQVARKLGEFGIRSKNVRIEYSQAKGFEREQFDEAFDRYLSPPAETVPPSQVNDGAAHGGTDDAAATVALPPSVPWESSSHAAWDGGTDAARRLGREHVEVEI